MNKRIPKSQAFKLIREKIAGFQKILKEATYENRYDTNYKKTYSGAKALLEELFSEKAASDFENDVRLMALPCYLGDPIDKGQELKRYKSHIEKCIAHFETFKERVQDFIPDEETNKTEPSKLSTEYGYEEIVKVIHSAGRQMERTPETYADLGEEGLRDVFLATLKGKATSETFNGRGKTDILVRHNDENVFIAECKIWNGRKKFKKAIDQLLSYLSWRDTKTAILMFYRGKKIIGVLDKIQPTVESHECYERKIGVDDKTAYRYEFHQRVDAKVKILLSVLVFHMPMEKKKKDKTHIDNVVTTEKIIPVVKREKSPSRKRLSDEQKLRLPRLSLEWGAWYGGPINGWFNEAEFHIKNIGGGSIVEMQIFISQGNDRSQIITPLTSLSKGEKKDIRFKFDPPPSQEQRKLPAPKLVFQVDIKDLLQHNIKTTYTWDSSSTNNPIVPGQTTVDGVPI